ncbi:MAG: hypothetical protein M3Y87_07365 [Myxococcota bacterium]|nr:hypothetical protein [Myxococcota bacterium]
MRERLILACAISLLGACGDPPATTDSGTETPDAGGLEIPVAPGDFSCVGSAMAPVGGADAAFMAHVYDFQGGASTNVANIGVQIFPSNTVSADCTGACQDLMTDATGNIAGVTAPQGGWFAYRVEAGATGGGTSPVLTVGYNRVAPGPGGMIDLPSVSSMTIGFIPSLYRRMRLPGTAIVSGSVVDCAGDEVQNAVLRVYRGDSEVLPGPNATDFFIGYFNGSGLPSATRQYTNTDGIYAAANVAASAEPIRVEVWARTEEGADLRAIACEEIEVFADAVTIISVGPLRNDYAAGTGCAALSAL